MGRGRMAPVIQEIVRKPFPMAAQFRGSTFPDATAVPLADGGADDCAENVCQTSETAGIYGMIFSRRALVQNREISKLLPYIADVLVPRAKTVPAMVLWPYMP